MKPLFSRRVQTWVGAGLLAGATVPQAFAAPQTQSIRLDPGWNLVAFQVVPANPAPAAVFGTLGGTFDRAFAYDNAAKTWTTFGTTGDTKGLDQSAAMGPVIVGRAYWVYVKSAVPAWSVSGEVPVPTPAVNLAQGWNLIGVPAGTTQLPEAVSLPSVLAAAGLDYDTVLRWEQSLFTKFTPSDADVDDFTAFDPNRGYWVNVKSASFSLQATLLAAVRGDEDREPQGNYPAREDLRLSDSATPLSGTDQTHIVFRPNEDTQQLALSNTGGGILLWELDTSLAPWLVASVKQGVVTIENDVITLSVDRRLATTGHHEGIIRLRTSAGDKSYKVVADIAPLAGDWRGTASLNEANGHRNPLPGVDLPLSFFEDPSSPGLVRGQLNSQNALLWPVDVPLIGHFGGSDGTTFRLSGGYVLPPGDVNRAPLGQFDGAAEDIDWNCNGRLDAVNPFPFPIYRAVTLTGRLVSGRADLGYVIEGDYSEVIFGMRRDPIRLQGTFSIRREAAAAFASYKVAANTENAAGTQPVVVRATPSATITTLPAGTVNNKLSVGTELALAAVTVDLDLGDVPPANLKISLLSPGGRRVVLHDHTAVTSLRSVSFPATRVPQEDLAVLATSGARTKGDWTLQIENVGGPTGKLFGWSLRLVGQPVFDVAGKVSDAMGNALPAQIFLDGLAVSEIAQAGADGTFKFNRLPGIPLNFTANLAGFNAENLLVPGLGRAFTVPGYTSACMSAEKTAALNKLRPLPVTPVPAAAVDGFAPEFGSTGKPYELHLVDASPAKSPLTLKAAPLMGFAPLPATLSVTPAASLADPSLSWNFGDGTFNQTGTPTTREHTFANVSPTGFTVTVQAKQKALTDADPPEGKPVTLTQAVYPLPSPGNSPYPLNFFLLNFTGGGSVPAGVASQVVGTNDVTKPASLATLLTVQHAYAASFDLDLAPKATVGGKFADDGFDPGNTLSNSANRDGNFRDEDYNYTVTQGTGPGQWELAADCGYAVPDDIFHAHPKPGQTGDCAAPRFAILCNLGAAIVPATVSEVFPADTTIFPNDPDPLEQTDASGLASARGQVLVTGPLAPLWNERSPR